MISYGKQYIDESDVESVNRVLRSDYLTQGPSVDIFEKDLSRYLGVEYVSCVSSGTSALHIACLSINLGPGDSLWTSPNSFLASANCARYCQADVDFVDIDINTGCMDPNLLKEKLENTPENEHPKAVVFVAYAGFPCKLDEISDICHQYGIKLIEDACHALGAEFKSNKVGSCRYSDITVFSFHPIKSITTLEGGALTTNDENLKKKFDLFRAHGVSKDNQKYPWEYEMSLLGYNYRLNDVSAALGTSQLHKLPEFIRRRRDIVTRYSKELTFDGSLIQDEFISQSACHLASLKFNFIDNLNDAVGFYSYMKSNGVGVQKHYIPIHTQPYYREKLNNISLPESEDFYVKQFSIPVHYGLDDASIENVISLINNYQG